MKKRKADPLKDYQQGYQALLESRHRALNHCCPRCQGILDAENLHEVKCRKCKRTFYVTEILKSAS